MKFERIIAVDPGRQSAWLDVQGDNMEISLLYCRDPHMGFTLNTFYLHGLSLGEDHRVDHIVYEQPYVRSHTSARMQYAMTGILELVAYQLNALAHSVHPSSVKKFATGKGNASKDEMIYAAKTIAPINISNDHEADAFWIYKYFEAVVL
jgi:hypothetical protein